MIISVKINNSSLFHADFCNDKGPDCAQKENACKKKLGAMKKNTLVMAKELMKNCAPEGINIQELSKNILTKPAVYFGAMIVVNSKVPKPEFFDDMQSCIMEKNMVR